MDHSGSHIRSLIVRFFKFLLKLYPPGFRGEFSSEIQEIVLSRVRHAEQLGGIAWLSAVYQEIIGLVPSIILECWHEMRFQKVKVTVSGPHLQKASFSKTIAYIRWADPPLWLITFASLLPLWLLSFAFTARSYELAVILLVLTGAVCIILLWLGWFTPELILYSLFLFTTLFIFEELPVLYKTTFRLSCTLILTIGIVGYRISLHRDAISLAWLILLVVFIGTWFLASHAGQNYWQMVNETRWWVLFFSP